MSNYFSDRELGPKVRTEQTLSPLDAIRDVRNNQYNGVPPSEADLALALPSMNRLVPQLMGLLQPTLK
jgi:hypothetical protein